VAFGLGPIAARMCKARPGGAWRAGRSRRTYCAICTRRSGIALKTLRTCRPDQACRTWRTWRTWRTLRTCRRAGRLRHVEQRPTGNRVGMLGDVLAVGALDHLDRRVMQRRHDADRDVGEQHAYDRAMP